MKRSIIGCLLAIPMLSMGQSNYQKGYVLNNSKDTLKGYVDYKPKISSQNSITFKSNLDAQPQTFNAQTAKGYGFQSGFSFESYTVRISKGTTKTEALKVGLDTSTRGATVFLRVLQTGPNVTIYSYTDDIKEHFYVRGSSSTQPYELMRARYIEANNSNKIITTDRYKGQLLFEMRAYNTGTEFYEGDFEDMAYSESDMVRIGAIINRMKERQARKSSRYFVGAGVGAGTVKYTGQHPLANSGAVSTVSYLPSINLGIDLAAKTLSERVNYRAELSLFLGKDEKVTNGQYIHSFDHMTLYLAPKILYNVYNTQQLKAYLGLGAGLSYSSYSNSKAGKVVSVAMNGDDFTAENISLSATAFSYNLNAGLVFKKIELNVMYVPPYKVSDYAGFNILTGIMHAGIKYRFD